MGQRPEYLSLEIPQTKSQSNPESNEYCNCDRTGLSNSRCVGWEYVHVAIDDQSRIAASYIFPDEKKESAIAALKSTVAFYERFGSTVEPVMTPLGRLLRNPLPGRGTMAVVISRMMLLMPVRNSV